MSALRQIFQSKISVWFPVSNTVRHFSESKHTNNQEENDPDNSKIRWFHKQPLHRYEKPVFWLGKAKLNDFVTLKNVITERDAALRCLLQGKNEDLILGENNLREFEFMKSKLIFPNSDDASQHTELEEIDLESIPQAPMLRQGALIHRADHWAQSKVWNPQASPWKMQHFYLYYDTFFARPTLGKDGEPHLKVEIDTKAIRSVELMKYVPAIRREGWNTGFKISFDKPQIVASTEPPQKHVLFITADLADAEYWQQRLRVARFYSVRMKCQSRQRFLDRYPYLVEYEWVVSGRGRGDLVFASPHGDFAVVEAKTINHDKSGSTHRSNRNNARKVVREQSRRYLDIYNELLQDVGFRPRSLKSFVYTNDNAELLVEIEVFPNPKYRWHGLAQCDDDVDLLEKNVEPLSLAF